MDLSIPLAGRAGRFGLPNFASFYTQEQFVIPNPVINCTTASFTNPIPNYTNCITQNVQYTYSWNFGDGTTSIEQNPTHIYLSSGVFNVSVTITGPCTSTTINKVVNIPPGGITVSVYTN